MSYRLRTGKVTGRDHLLDGRNCQDALYSLAFGIDGEPYLTGAIADGCGEGLYSEVGACLATPFICHAARHYLSEGHDPDGLPGALFERLRRFLALVLDGYAFCTEQERARFVHDHLLFTLIGFMITPWQTTIFAWGDGLVLLNDTLYHCARQESPAYLGYQLVGTEEVGAESFAVYSLPSADLRRLAIGSDAWIDEQPLLEQLWQRTSPAGLQMLMNKWSDAHHFRDDASLITIERIESAGVAETGAEA